MCILPNEPACLCAKNVMMPIASDNETNGIFSINTFPFSFLFLKTSIQSIANGNTTADGLDNNERTKKKMANQYCFFEFVSTYLVYVINPPRKNMPYKTSFRSETQATDSTWTGWMPNKIAVVNEIIVLFLLRDIERRNTRKQLIKWNIRLSKW